MVIQENSLKKVLNIDEHKIETSITKIEPNKIITRGFSQEDLIANISCSEMVYLLFKGELPSKKEAKILNHVLISFCDHGVTPPSTQSSRLIASSGSPLNSALAGGLLSFGKKHAGAIEESMELFQEIIKNHRSTDQNISELAKNIVEYYLAKNEKIPGFGHRYHSKDPRAAKLIELVKEDDFIGPHLELVLAIEDILFDKKRIHINVDGVNAAILLDMGFSSTLGFGVFMIGRIPGIIAHINEECTDEEEFRKFCDIKDISYCGDENKFLDRI